MARRLPRSRRLRRHGAKGKFRAVRLAFIKGRLRPASVEPERWQLQVLGMGLMGTGKSTLLRGLAWILDGIWLNQDEFSHLGKNAKWKLLEAVRKAACASDAGTAVVVDKINTLRSHRSEFLSALSGDADGAVVQQRRRVLLRFLHPKDPPGHIAKEAVKLGLSRIAARGAAHRSLFADNPKLQSILEGTAKGFEAPSAAELAEFNAVLDVDITSSPEEALTSVVNGLHARRLISDEQRMRPVSHALDVANEHEAKLRPAEAPPSALPALRRTLVADEASDRKRQRLEDEVPTARPLPVYWGVFFDMACCETAQCFEKLQKVVQASGISYSRSIAEPHVTLVFAGCAANEEEAAKKQAIPVAEFSNARAQCEQWLDKQVEIVLEKVVRNGDAACATVALPLGLSSTNRHPHITLAHSSRVGPIYSSQLLKLAETEGWCEDAASQSTTTRPLDGGSRLRGIVRAFWGNSNHNNINNNGRAQKTQLSHT